jgi:hypothetical protein
VTNETHQTRGALVAGHLEPTSRPARRPIAPVVERGALPRRTARQSAAIHPSGIRAGCLRVDGSAPSGIGIRPVACAGGAPLTAAAGSEARARPPRSTLPSLGSRRRFVDSSAIVSQLESLRLCGAPSRGQHWTGREESTSRESAFRRGPARSGSWSRGHEPKRGTGGAPCTQGITPRMPTFDRLMIGCC